MNSFSVNSVANSSVVKALIAECIGTFAVVFTGILSIQAVNIVQAPNGVANLASIGLSYGLAVAVMVASLGTISGGHFNPAVTSAYMATGLIAPALGILYILAQLVGGTAAGILIANLFSQQAVGAGTPALAPQVTATAGIILESIATFFLVAVIFGTAVDKRAPQSVYPFAIGCTIALGVMSIGPLTGGAMNPARTFGAALASGMWSNHAVYWVGPIVGGVLAGLIYNFVLIHKQQ
ncbi:MAG: aquaporin [Bacteroidota bacterium]|nr:aquaporin [Candidatus Kapabacteria bacterium]MDW8219110.1 aquaporin [Bacteroidota bacterium]